MPSNPDDLRYTQDHVWVRVNAGTATIGITDYAQRQLGEIVLVELGGVGELVAVNEPFGTVEAVKAVTESSCRSRGRSSTSTNRRSTIRRSSTTILYGKGWMAKVKPSSAKDLDALMRSQAYAAYTETSGD